MSDENPAPKPAPKPKRRRARRSLKIRRQIKEAQLGEAKARKLSKEEERQKKINEAKEAIRKMIAEETVREEAKLAQNRPAIVVEFCKAQGLPVNTQYHPKYNMVGVPHDWPMQFVEGIGFARPWPSELGGLGAYLHFKEFAKITWPDIEWNPWLEEMIKSLCDTEHEIQSGGTRMRFVNWVGAGSAGKTYAAGLFACAWYMTDICNSRNPRSSVTLTSTSKGIIAQRIWPVIQKFFHEAKYENGDRWRWGHMIDSQKIICGMSMTAGEEKKRDQKHSICALAVESGELQGSLDKIKGRHTERMLVIIDEANSTPQAIFECIPNMLTSVRELIVLVIGNGGSRLDPHGICCEPKAGWKSITVEDFEWETKGVAKWGIQPGICLHFDGAKSPNVKAGKTLHKHIYSFERWEQVLKQGEEYRNTLQHWYQDRGFWPPDGLSSTVFSEALVESHDGAGSFDFFSESNPCGALDPAFGGDDCLVQWGMEGDIRLGRRALLLTQWQLVPFDPDSPDPIDYQIARWIIRECKQRGVQPKWFGLDATGIGRGIAAIIRHEWSNQIHVVEFGGAASDLPASQDDPRPSKEVYANRVTELWYSARELLIADQLKGLYPEAVREACSRVYEIISRKYKVEAKTDMKVRLGRSPDHFDAITVLCDVTRRNGLIVASPKGGSKRNESDWDSIQSDLTKLTEASYSEQAHFGQYADVDAF